MPSARIALHSSRDKRPVPNTAPKRRDRPSNPAVSQGQTFLLATLETMQMVCPLPGPIGGQAFEKSPERAPKAAAVPFAVFHEGRIPWGQTFFRRRLCRVKRSVPPTGDEGRRREEKWKIEGQAFGFARQARRDKGTGLPGLTKVVPEASGSFDYTLTFSSDPIRAVDTANFPSAATPIHKTFTSLSPTSFAPLGSVTAPSGAVIYIPAGSIAFLPEPWEYGLATTSGLLVFAFLRRRSTFLRSASQSHSE